MLFGGTSRDQLCATERHRIDVSKYLQIGKMNNESKAEKVGEQVDSDITLVCELAALFRAPKSCPHISCIGD
jgi:hypothetical protein